MSTKDHEYILPDRTVVALWRDRNLKFHEYDPRTSVTSSGPAIPDDVDRQVPVSPRGRGWVDALNELSRQLDTGRLQYDEPLRRTTVLALCDTPGMPFSWAHSSTVLACLIPVGRAIGFWGTGRTVRRSFRAGVRRVTDADWRVTWPRRAEEVNFWGPAGDRAFRALSVGDPFFFKTHNPDNRIVGGGFFSGFASLTISNAWLREHRQNGAPHCITQPCG